MFFPRFFLALACAFTPFSAAAQEAPPKPVITIEADMWCPINCTPADARPGVGIEIAKKIFEPLGYRINYVIVPWTQALADARAGRTDAVVGANHQDDATLIFPTKMLYSLSDDFYVKVGDPWRFQGVYSLKGRHIGVIKDYGYGDVVRKYIQDNKGMARTIFEATGTDALPQNIRDLIAGKFDVVIESRPVMDYTIMRLGLSDKVKWVGSLPQDPVFVAFSPAKPASRALAQQYDSGIARLTASGELEAIYKAYALQLP